MQLAELLETLVEKCCCIFLFLFITKLSSQYNLSGITAALTGAELKVAHNY